MGRTIPSFRIALAMEKEEWKPFRSALDSVSSLQRTEGCISEVEQIV
jgi:hypothetical protein